MNKFTREEKEQIIRLACKAEDFFFKYLEFCEKIEELLNDKNPNEKDFVKEILYQMSDGVCVSYEKPEDRVPVNIPVLTYIRGDRVGNCLQ